ncbi:MAG: TetR family transcriptional regulator [Rhodopseudomonas sp.]|nr:TetR family transcriptional regulator [Rhodopseudomonas sp.]
MRVSREKAAENRARVIAAASRLFREKGFNGVGVADIMQAADLTHGGFYGQFDSKEDLAAQACQAANATSAKVWQGIAEHAPDKPLQALVDHYLARKHRDKPATGCAFAALAIDAARQGENVRQVFTEGLMSLVDILAAAMPDGSKPQRRRQALAAMSELIGAVILARAVHDPVLSDDILSAARKDILATNTPPSD